jgi:hypothetical protein
LAWARDAVVCKSSLGEFRRSKADDERFGRRPERFEAQWRRIVMMLIGPPARRTSFWQRRVSALLMLVLQLGMVLAPMAEHEGRRTVTHVEQQGTRHAQLHNEATCALCAVRSLQAAVLQVPHVITVAIATERLVSVPATALASRDPPPSNASRAPPRLS